MSQANILLGIAVLVWLLTLVYFFRLMQCEPSQRALLTASKPGKYVNFFVTVPIVLVLVLGSFRIRVAAAICLLLTVLALAIYQRRWLRAHGADRTFLKRLLLSSVGFALAIVLFTGSIIFRG